MYLYIFLNLKRKCWTYTGMIIWDAFDWRYTKYDSQYLFFSNNFEVVCCFFTRDNVFFFFSIFFSSQLGKWSKNIFFRCGKYSEYCNSRYDSLCAKMWNFDFLRPFFDQKGSFFDLPLMGTCYFIFAIESEYAKKIMFFDIFFRPYTP